MLNQFTEGIWICDSPLKVAGVELGSRMTVINLGGSGSLFVHSPVRLNDTLKKQLNSLGTVDFVVAPNKWHHLFISDFKLAFPQAKFYCAPGLERKRSNFRFDGVIGEGQTFPWNRYLEHLLVDGIPMINEVVFFEPKSKTMILTDLAIHICESQSYLTRIVLTLLGAYGKFGWSRIEKRLFIKDKAAFAKSVEKILARDFERIVLAHGMSITTGGKAHFQKAFA